MKTGNEKKLIQLTNKRKAKLADLTVPQVLLSKYDLLTTFKTAKNMDIANNYGKLSSGKDNRFIHPRDIRKIRNEKERLKIIENTSRDLSYMLEPKMNDTIPTSCIMDTIESGGLNILPQIGVIYRDGNNEIDDKTKHKGNVKPDKLMKLHLKTIYKSMDILNDPKLLKEQEDDFKRSKFSLLYSDS